MLSARGTIARISAVILLIAVAAMLFGCGLFDDGQKPEAAMFVEPPAATTSASVAPAPPAYDGPSSLEERILASPVIARVRLDSTTSTVESGATYLGMKYSALLEFNFSVLEYLKGKPPTGSDDNGANDIVAVWAAAPFFDTRQEAEAALPAIVAARNTQWDGREAIVFLKHSETTLPSTQQADRYYLAWGGSRPQYSADDNYSIASRHNKLWLPAETPSQPSGDQRRFLMDAPPATGTAPTITLGEMKSRIAAVAAKLAASDGSEEYSECVSRNISLRGEKQLSYGDRRPQLLY